MVKLPSSSVPDFPRITERAPASWYKAGLEEAAGRSKEAFAGIWGDEGDPAAFLCCSVRPKLPPGAGAASGPAHFSLLLPLS